MMKMETSAESKILERKGGKEKEERRANDRRGQEDKNRNKRGSEERKQTRAKDIRKGNRRD